MSTRQLHRPLEADTLREIERALRGKLKAFDLSDSFIERCIEDAVQKGLVEYLRALDNGEVVDNRNGFVVRAGFCRAIDELRREARHADGAVVDAIIDSGTASEPPTDEVAIEYLQAEELREAVGQLSPEEQQVLSLHYFEEKTAEASAEALFCSERTYRRRLKQALRKLGRLLDAPVPEPGSELAIEVGVVVWVGLSGAKVVLSRGPFDPLIGVAHAAHDGAVWLGGRARDLISRMIGSGASERVAAVASSGPGKAAGCLMACVLAAGTTAELVGVGGGGGSHPRDRAAIHREARKRSVPAPLVQAPAVPIPEPSGNSSSPPAGANAGQSPTSPAARAAKREKEAAEVVTSQQPESAVVGAPPEPAPEPSSPPSSSSSSASPTEVADEQFGP